MRHLLLIAATVLVGCGGPSDELVKREFKNWCGQLQDCRPVKEVKSISHTKSSETLVQTKIVFVRGWDDLVVATARCTFGNPKGAWQLQKCSFR